MYAALGTPTRVLCPGRLGSLVLVPIGATPTVLGVCPPFLCSRRPVLPSGVSSLHTPPGCVGLLPPGYTCTRTRFEVVKYVGVGLVGWWGRVVARPRPPRRAGATPISWPPKGRALMAVTWHDHLLPCACGVAHALDQGSGAACASGLGRSSSRRGCSRAGAPPSAPLLMSGFWSALCALALTSKLQGCGIEPQSRRRSILGRSPLSIDILAPMAVEPRG